MRWTWLGLALVIGVVGSWLAVRLDADPWGPRSPEHVVRDFYRAQRDGDCERLVDLVTQASWSDGGRRRRGEFLEQCADAIAGYRPEPVAGAIRTVDENGDEDAGGDRAVMVPSSSEVRTRFRVEPDGDPVRARLCPWPVPCGILAREGGEWKVETDGALLRIGPSVEETLRGYLAAYRAGDCDRLAGHLSESARSAGGVRGRTQFLAECRDAATARERVDGPLPVRFGHIRASSSLGGDDRARVVVELILPEGGLIGGRYLEPVVLVEEGLRWRLEGSPGLPSSVPPGTRLLVLRYLELQALMPDEIRVRGRGGRPGCADQDAFVESEDAPAEHDDVDADLGIRRDFFWQNCDGRRLAGEGAALTLYDFPAGQAARAAAERLAAGLTNVDWRRPHEAVEVPGLPQAFGVRFACDGQVTLDRCSRLAVVVAHRQMVLTLELDDLAGGPADAAEVLATQLKRL